MFLLKKLWTLCLFYFDSFLKKIFVLKIIIDYHNGVMLRIYFVSSKINCKNAICYLCMIVKISTTKQNR